MTKTEIRQYLLEEDNRLTVHINGKFDATQKILDKIYEVLSKGEYDLLKDFLRTDGRLVQIESMLHDFRFCDNR